MSPRQNLDKIVPRILPENNGPPVCVGFVVRLEKSRVDGTIILASAPAPCVGLSVPRSEGPKGKVVALFSAEGSQYIDRGRELVLNFPCLRQDYGYMEIGDKPDLAVALNPSRQKNSDRQLRSAVVQLRVAGLPLKNLDDYQLEPKTPEAQKNNVLSVRLGSVNDVSEKTKMAFKKAWQNRHQLKSPTVAQDRAKSAPVATLKTSEPNPQPKPEGSLNYQRVLDSLEYVLTQFNHHQGHILQVHEQFLKHQTEYVKTFFQLMQQNFLFGNGKSAQSQAQTKPGVMESSESSMMRFHDHQAETLRLHEQYLNQQMEYAKTFFQLIQQQYDLLITGDSTLFTTAPVAVHTNGLVTSPYPASSNSSPVSLAALEPSSHQQYLNHNIIRGLVRLKTQHPPDFLDFTLPKFSVGLITDDGSLTTSKLAQSLTERGWKVVVLSFPQFLVAERSPLPEGITRVVLKDLSEEHLKQQLAVIANYGSIAAFIHLNPSIQDAQSKDIRYLEVSAALVKQVFLIAKHLKQPLNEAARQGRSCFITVAHLDGEFGTGRKTNFGAISGGLFGLTKTLKQEWSAVFCRAIDLSPDLDVEQTVQYILAELHDPNRLIAEVGYSFQGRTTLVCTPDTVNK